MITVAVRHNFETAHRLYGQGQTSKCWNLHGHSFWCEIEVGGEADPHGMIVEYGAFKMALRSYIDSNLDHGAVLNTNDPLCDALDGEHSKVLRLPADPTVEALARHLAAVVDESVLPKLPNGTRCKVVRVHLDETQTNSATWTR